MSTALSASHSDAAFFRKRKAMVMLPLVVAPFIIALFPILGGGKGERYADGSTVDGKAGTTGFNASVPVARNGAISGRDVEGPGYGKAVVGQVLSNFTNTQHDSSARGLKAIPISSDKQASGHHHSSLAGATSSVGASPRQDIARNNSATAVSATGKTRTTKTYSGIVGQILEPDALIDFTLGQPNTYRERFLSDKETRANGELRIVNTIKAGTYPMGLEAKPLPTGQTADLVLYLPGPQLYLTRTGTLTVTNSTIIKQEGTTSLYRLSGSFLVTMYGSGTGIPQGQGDIPITGSFDVLLSDNK